MEGFIRPKARVLPESAALPDRNLIVPPPNQFTHEIARSVPYWYERATDDPAPAGEFPSGTPVTLLVHDGGPFCRVVDGRGLYVEMEFDALRPRAQD